jgi:hypothetical protein
MEERRPYQLYDTQDFLELEDNPDRWLVEQMVPWPGKTVAHGKGGEYKSTLFFDLAVATASGGELLQEFPVLRHGPALVISTEGNIYANRDRLFSHMRPRNLHPSTVKLFYGQESLFVDEDVEFNVLVDLVEHAKPVMLLLDPFVSFFSGDENSVSDVKKFLRRMDPLIQDLKFEVAREQALPGVPEPVNILTVECTKQRNGKEGKLFTAVPFIDDDLGQVSFGIYREVQAKDVAAIYLRQIVYKALRDANAPLTRKQLRDHFGVGPQRMSKALDALVNLDLVELVQDRRSTGGSRTRSVEAFGARAKDSIVDEVRRIIAREAARRPGGSKAYAVDERDAGGVCLAGISKRPKV